MSRTSRGRGGLSSGKTVQIHGRGQGESFLDFRASAEENLASVGQYVESVPRRVPLNSGLLGIAVLGIPAKMLVRSRLQLCFEILLPLGALR